LIRAIFVRHGQSTANIGLPTEDFALVPLTELGHEQAKAVAAQWDVTPSRIFVSPFLRTQQTAAPTLKRFADVPTESWDIYEFTLWDPAFWTGGEPRDQMEKVALYWSTADPDLRYGGGAESFSMMLERARTTLHKLEKLDVDASVVLFSHGHFIQAVRQVILHPEWTDKQMMQDFLAFDEAQWVQNTQRVTAEFDGMSWKID
jgi:broad specificity phosphatase PhoE